MLESLLAKEDRDYARRERLAAAEASRPVCEQESTQPVVHLRPIVPFVPRPPQRRKPRR
jgi:hypothetical protein